MGKNAKITDILPQKNKKRFNIYLDQRFAFGLSAEALVKAGLKIGQEISKKDTKKLRYQDTKNSLYEKVLRFLSYRPRSEKEVRDYADGKLAPRKGKTPAYHRRAEKAKIIDKIISKLKKQGLIDDQEFAEWWAEQRIRFRPKGTIALKIELRKKGLNKEIIEAAIEKIDEIALAKRALQKKLKSFRKLPSEKGRQKIIDFLARRGFPWPVIQKVLAEISQKR